MRAKRRILCAGLVTVDVMYFVDQLPAEGEKHRAQSARMIAGGGALYAAATVAAIGGEAALIGAIGDDLFGAFIRQEVTRLGIDASMLVTVPGVPSAHSAILVDAAGERTIVNQRDPRLFSTSPPLSTGFDAVLLDTRWPAVAAPLLQAARDAGKPAVVDAEAPLADFKDLLPLASHVAFSEQGLKDFTGDPGLGGLTQAADQLQNWTCVTRGPRSVLFHDADGPSEVSVRPVTAKNTLGAGDVWHGAFALALAEGLSEARAIDRANAVAGERVQQSAPITAQ